MIEQAVAFVGFFAFVGMAISLFMILEETGTNFLNFSLLDLVPSRHQSDEGRLWARRYWLSCLVALIALGSLAGMEVFEMLVKELKS